MDLARKVLGPKRSHPPSITTSSPLVIKRSGKLLNFVQKYGVEHDKNIIHYGKTDASGTVFSVIHRGYNTIVKMNEAMSPLWNYFEVEIISHGESCAIGIGVGAYDNPLQSMPGCTARSFGYHSDDGYLFHQSGYAGLRFGPTCMKGDIMGCGIDYDGLASTGYVRLWFTQNSTVVGAPVMAKVPSRGFHSLIGMHYLGDHEVVKYLGHSQQKTPYSLQVLANYPFPSTLITKFPQDGIGPKQLTLPVGDEVIVTEEEWLQGCEWLEGTKGSDGTVGLFCRKLVQFQGQTQQLESAASAEGEKANQVHIYKGKSFAFVKEPETWYACIICQELAEAPLQTTCCAQTLCNNCTDTYRKRNLETCPHCRKAHWETSPDARLTRLIGDMEVLCHNHLKGCQWQGELRDMQNHLSNKCDFDFIQCPAGCSLMIERRHLTQHAQAECLDAQVTCLFCNTAMLQRELLYHHHKVCANWPALCPNMCKEGKSWTHSELIQHLQDGCDEEIIKCEFASAGCSVEVKRMDLKGHMQSAMASHLTLLLKENLALKKEVKGLKDTMQTLQRRLS